MKKICLIFAFFCLIFTLTACGNQNSSGNSSEAMELTIATMPSIDKVPMIIGKEQGFFKKYGLDVTIENFQSPTDRNAALQAGNLDGLASDLVADVLYLEGGYDLTVTSLIQTDFAILASKKSGITSISDITADDTLGISLSGVIEYIADSAMKCNKLDLSNVMTRVEELTAGKIDLTIVPEPYGASAEAAGNVKISSADDLGIFSAVMLFTNDTIEAKPEAITAFYKGCQDAIDYLNSTDSAEYIDTVIEKGEFSEAVADYIGNYKFVPLTAVEESQFNAAQAWMNSKPEEFGGTYNYKFEDISNFSFLTK